MSSPYADQSVREQLALYGASDLQIRANRRHPYPVVSLFSGAMGLDLGLQKAGLHTVVAQDIDPWCIETIRRNGHIAVKGDLRELLNTSSGAQALVEAAGIRVDRLFAVVGGPPCQPFSTAGKRLGASDERGQLFEYFLEVVDQLRPRFFVMENVKGLASMPSSLDEPGSQPLLEVILERIDKLGYRAVHGVLDAVHYGTPQFRERLVIIGSRDGEDVFLPEPTHFPHHQNPDMRWRTFRDAVADLTDIGPCARFSSTTQSWIEQVPEGGNWKSLPLELRREAMGGAFESGGGKVGFFRRLTQDEPAPTLVTSPVQKATLLAHPKEHRPLSVNEYARIQGFPDDWRFLGKAADCYRQIGNAVPVPLGMAIGQALVATALGNATVKVKRMRGTSVHRRVSRFWQEEPK